MMLQYFGLDEDPFGVTPEPRYLFFSNTHREAQASLQYSFDSGRGFTALIAPPGMGKTTLLYSFLDDIRSYARSAFLFDVDNQCEPRELIARILRDIDIAPAQTTAEMHEQLHGVLEEEARAGRKFALVIDEAQNLSDAALETVRLLTNFETPSAKLIHVILSGQPQLSARLMQPSLTQLRQRIATVSSLEPFSDGEARAYIDHRLKLAGYGGQSLFSQHALGVIAKESGGIPRIINNLCFNSLSLCCAMKGKQVNRSMVAEVIADLELHSNPRETAANVSVFAATPGVNRERILRLTRMTKVSIPVAAVLCMVSILGVVELSRLGALPFHQQTRTGSLNVNGPRSGDPALALAGSKILPPVGRGPGSGPFEITVEPNDTLRNIAVRYLGEFSPECLRKIQMLNPTIQDPDHIEVGQNILLPARPAATMAEDPMLPGTVRNLP
jgi:type II secretory pathway predicted ATPase ExeA